MKVVKDSPIIKVTKWMKFKAYLALKIQNIQSATSFKKKVAKEFLIKFFNIKQLAYATFTYEVVCGYKTPKRNEFIALAKISRNATPDQIKERLFTLKAPSDDCKINVINLKLMPVGKLKQV